MENNRHIWEGWTVQDFINELEITFRYQQFKTKDDVKKMVQVRATILQETYSGGS